MIFKYIIPLIFSTVYLTSIFQQEVVGGEISSIQSLNEASMDGNLQHINDPSIEDNHHINAASINEDYSNINEASMEEEPHHNINAASINQDYHDLNSLSISLNDDQYEERRPIDITKKLKDLGSRITSFFIGDNENEESSVYLTESTVHSRLDSNKNKNGETLNENKNLSQENLSELSRKIANFGEMKDYNKNTNEADLKNVNKNFDDHNMNDKYILSKDLRVNSNEIKRGKKNFEDHNTRNKYILPEDSRVGSNDALKGNTNLEDHNHIISSEDLRVNTDEIKSGNQNFKDHNINNKLISEDLKVTNGNDFELQDDYFINSMPLLKQYLNKFSKMEPQINLQSSLTPHVNQRSSLTPQIDLRSSLTPQMRPRHDHPGLKRIKSFLTSTNTQIMNSSSPGFRGEPQYLNTFGKKLKGLRYDME